MSEDVQPYAIPRASRGISQVDVDGAADRLLRQGERPTVEKVRSLIGGSPNTIIPLLDAWWRRLASRIKARPDALSRVPLQVAHAVEALFMLLVDASREQAEAEVLRQREKNISEEQRLHERSLKLTWREQELRDALTREGKRTADLEAQLHAQILQSNLHLAARDAAEAKSARLLKEIAQLEQRMNTRRARPTSGKRKTSKKAQRGSSRRTSKKSSRGK